MGIYTLIRSLFAFCRGMWWAWDKTADDHLLLPASSRLQQSVHRCSGQGRGGDKQAHTLTKLRLSCTDVNYITNTMALRQFACRRVSVTEIEECCWHDIVLSDRSLIVVCCDKVQLFLHWPVGRSWPVLEADDGNSLFDLAQQCQPQPRLPQARSQHHN